MTATIELALLIFDKQPAKFCWVSMSEDCVVSHLITQCNRSQSRHSASDLDGSIAFKRSLYMRGTHEGRKRGSDFAYSPMSPVHHRRCRQIPHLHTRSSLSHHALSGKQVIIHRASEAFEVDVNVICEVNRRSAVSETAQAQGKYSHSRRTSTG